MKKRILLIALFIILQNNHLHSENCILNSGSANDINKYNQCIANQMQMARNQNRMELEYLRNEIIKLKEENFVLKQKLDQIKDTLKNIFLNL
jgi:hypothetical protein